jgi:metal-dependent HD superfamily phosphatase/phosphodiesterase
MKYNELIKNEEIKTYIIQADQSLKALGYTEHSFAHVCKVANDAAHILSLLNYDEHTIELAKIAGYLHDIGNVVNRINHSQSGAIMAFNILNELNMEPKDIALIVSAIGNHDEGSGVAVNEIAAALIIADKSDVRRSRVRNENFDRFDIHDRVNYSVTESELIVSNDEITLKLQIDTKISPIMDFFEIFLSRMTMCKNAANKLNMRFRLSINNQLII